MTRFTNWDKWTVWICQIHRGLHDCDFYVCETAKEAVMIKYGCNRCDILAPIEHEEV